MDGVYLWEHPDVQATAPSLLDRVGFHSYAARECVITCNT